MLGKHHLILSLSYGVVIFYPLNYWITDVVPFYFFSVPINIYYQFTLISVIFGSIVPDHGVNNSLVTKLFPTATSALEDFFYTPAKEKAKQKRHREITHPLLYNLPVFIMIGLIFIFAILGTFFLFFFLSTFFPPYEAFIATYGLFNPILIALVGGAGYVFGVFSHLLLDSTSIEGITIHRKKFNGFYYVGSEVEECGFVLVLYPILILASVEFLMVSFKFEETSLLFIFLSFGLFLTLGVLMQTKGMSHVIIPQKKCQKENTGNTTECGEPWYVREGSRGYFWGHHDWETGSCSETDDLDGTIIDTYSGLSSIGLKLYFKVKPSMSIISRKVAKIFPRFSNRLVIILLGICFVFVILWNVLLS